MSAEKIQRARALFLSITGSAPVGDWSVIPENDLDQLIGSFETMLGIDRTLREQLRKARDDASRLRWPDTTGS